MARGDHLERNIEKLLLAVESQLELPRRKKGEIATQLRDEAKALSTTSHSGPLSSLSIGYRRAIVIACAFMLVATVITAVVLTRHFAKKERLARQAAQQDSSRQSQDEKPAKPLSTEKTDAENAEMQAELEAQLKQIFAMAAAGDVGALIGMLRTGQFVSKLAAANYLGQLAGAEAIDVLQQMSTQWYDDKPGNPFVEAIDNIETRLERQRQQLAQDIRRREEEAKEAKEAAEAEQLRKLTTWHRLATTCTGIVRAASGEPIPGAAVTSRLYPGDRDKRLFHPGTLEAETVSADDGSFYLEMTNPGGPKRFDRSITFEHPQFATAWQHAPLGNLYDLRIRLMEPAVVTGVVVNADNLPLQAATVIARLKPDSGRAITDNSYITATTDSDGRFVIENIFAGTRVHIDVVAAGYVRYTTRQYGDGAYPIRAGTEDVWIEMLPGGTIFGQIVAEGKRYSGPRVNVVAVREGRTQGIATTDDSGQFEIAGLSAGVFTLDIDNADMVQTGLFYPGGQDIEVTAGRTSLALIQLQQGRGVILRLVDETTGRDPGSRRFSLFSRTNRPADPRRDRPLMTGHTNPAGGVMLSLAPGTYDLLTATWHEDSYKDIMRTFTVEAGEGNQIVIAEIDAGPVLTVQLIGPSGGGIEGYVWFGNRKLATDKDGVFIIAGQGRPAGSIPVGYAFSSDGALARAFVTRTSGEPNDLLIELKPLASIVGLVVDDDQQPVANPQVRLGLRLFATGRPLLDELEETVWTISSDESGWFHIERIPTGLPLTLFVGRDDDPTTMNIDDPGPEVLFIGQISQGSTGKNEADRVEWTETVAGRVTGPDNRPVIGLNVTAEAENHTVTDVTDINGRYELNGLGEGIIRLTAGDGLSENPLYDRSHVIGDSNDINIQLPQQEPK